MSKVRVRFAPSPTGGLHLGGVRTVLYNYLFARQHGGDFVLRIEDTDQSRYVPGAEEYIFECLNWCGLQPDEGPHSGGDYAPYRQSERKELYRKYAEQLVKDGYAYYAFDTPEEIEKMKKQLKAEGKGDLQYDHTTRMQMKNSLRLEPEETQQLLDTNSPNVIRIKINPGEHVSFNDMIRGYVEFNTNHIDDKVLLKADGMPTYHLAVVVDDYLMKISHAFRGEEWIPSAAVHILLWKYLGWKNHMPHWAHLPLILKPDGNGKLSKRDGDRLGFPVFAMNWQDAKSGEIIKGFKEIGFLPEAFINMLALLGWNDGTEQEIFSIDDLIQKFKIEKVHIAGAKFDFEKAKWFNHEWIKKLPVARYVLQVKKIFEENNLMITDDEKFEKVLNLIKDRCTLLTDFYSQGAFFFEAPTSFDEASVKAKWDAVKKEFFNLLINKYEESQIWSFEKIENIFKELAIEKKIKVGDLQMIFRIILVGSKMGPGVFAIAEILGTEETINRIQKSLSTF